MQFSMLMPLALASLAAASVKVTLYGGPNLQGPHEVYEVAQGSCVSTSIPGGSTTGSIVVSGGTCRIDYSSSNCESTSELVGNTLPVVRQFHSMRCYQESPASVSSALASASRTAAGKGATSTKSSAGSRTLGGTTGLAFSCGYLGLYMLAVVYGAR